MVIPVGEVPEGLYRRHGHFCSVPESLFQLMLKAFVRSWQSDKEGRMKFGFFPGDVSIDLSTLDGETLRSQFALI